MRPLANVWDTFTLTYVGQWRQYPWGRDNISAYWWMTGQDIHGSPHAHQSQISLTGSSSSISFLLTNMGHMPRSYGLIMRENMSMPLSKSTVQTVESNLGLLDCICPSGMEL